MKINFHKVIRGIMPLAASIIILAFIKNNSINIFATNSNTAKGVYNIVGKSNKLGPKTLASMTKWRNDIREMAIKNSDTMFLNGNTNEKLVSLTFDDGPDGNITPQIVKVLKEKMVCGNFFLIGNRVSLYKNVVKSEYASGNLVLSHTYSHLSLPGLNTKTVENEILNTDKAIFKVIGKVPAIIRPPYGATDDNLINTVKKYNKKIVIWSIDTLDWSQKDSNNITKNILDNLRPGDMVLMHCNEDKYHTLKALPGIIDGIKKKGYKIVTLDKLLNIKAYQ